MLNGADYMYVRMAGWEESELRGIYCCLAIELVLYRVDRHFAYVSSRFYDPAVFTFYFNDAFLSIRPI